MSRGPDAATLLRRAIEANARRAGCSIGIADCHSERWASATFVGGRHRLTITASQSAALDRWVAALPDADLPIRHHLVADVVLAGTRRSEDALSVTIEALTVAV